MASHDSSVPAPLFSKIPTGRLDRARARRRRARARRRRRRAMNASGVFRMSKKPAEEGAPSGGDGEAKTLDDDVVEATAASGPVSVEGGSRAREEDARETDEERDRKRTKTSGDESEEDDYEMSSDDGEDEDESDATKISKRRRPEDEARRSETGRRSSMGR